MTDTASFLRDLYPLRAQTSLPEAGRAWREPSVIWSRLVGQICAVGSGRSWDTITELRLWDDLSLEAIHAVGHPNDAVKTVHQVLVKAGVRYCSAQRDASIKAEAIVRNAQSPLFASGEVGFLTQLRRAPKEDDRIAWFQVTAVNLKSIHNHKNHKACTRVTPARAE